VLAEARLYRYPAAGERAAVGENPVDAHNHCLGALRYLIAGIDARFLARLRGRGAKPRADDKPLTVDPFNDESLWTGLL
jgi:hypothetical protein